jgi:gluconate 2-dehydrogenase gamma chain
MSTKKRSRRSFLLESATGLNAAWFAANYHGILVAQEHAQGGKGQPPRLEFFDGAQAVEIEAMAAQIIPADETPGAREAHCLYFIDKALCTFARGSQPVYTQGLRDLQDKVQQLHPGTAKFSDLNSEQQIQTLTAIEKTPFFNMVRTHTVIGFLSRPVHGGNHDQIGWKLIGYEDTLNHKPPFGFYDAQALGAPAGAKEK